ncbi:hypothetical protein [Paenibacillus ginsengihumi]|jgi:hypothetical protein|uniref:hypothetical protein n=1 Tax=Paenibacillus ginsengihumi TaxID=431596 RepID=UPI00036EFF18|nr:hypothetical protein [Paenibacillus ginsengihumi]
MQSGDGIVVIVIVAALVVWLSISLRNRMREKVEGGASWELLAGDGDVEPDEATKLLEKNGYRVFAGKTRIPIDIEVNGSKTLHSRLFVDYFAAKGAERYAVKLARERMMLEMTGSGLRDKLLVYQLIVPGLTGVLYVDLPSKTIQVFEFTARLAGGDEL